MTTHKLPAILAPLALLVLLAGLFAPALFQGKILAPLDITTSLLAPWGEVSDGAKPHNQSPSDAVTQYLPYRIFAEKSLREDGYIGWNPYEMGGYSMAANTMALPGTWTMQLHRFLPFTQAWNLGIIAEFLIAGTGMLLFLRSRELSWLPCLIGAVAFMFNAQFVIWIYHRWALSSFCWMPWLLWSAVDWKGDLTIRRCLLPFWLALALMGASLQHMVFVFFTCVCLFLAALPPLRGAVRETISSIGKLVLSWAAVWFLATGMSAFTIVPQVQGYLTNLDIGHIRGGIGYEHGLSQILLHIILIPARIWPWLAGDPQSMDAWKLLKSDFMELNYLGTIPMLLGFAGLFVRSMPRPAKWLIAVGLLVPLTPLVGPLYHRVELLFILGATWMTSEMLHHLQSHSSIQNPKSKIQNSNLSPSSPVSSIIPSRAFFNWQRLLITTVASIGVALLIGTSIPSGTRSKLESQVATKALAKSADAQFGADKEWIAARATEWTRRFSLTHPHTAWVYGLLILGSTGLLLASSFKNQKTKNISENSPSFLSSSHTTGQLMILAATSLELATLFQTWTTFSDPADLLPKNPAIETIRSLASQHRVLQSAPDAGFAAMFATPNLLAAQSIPSIDGYESIQYRSALTATQGSPDALRLTLAGVGIAVQPSGLTQPGTESWPVVETLGTYTLRRNPAVPSPVSAGATPAPTTLPDITTSLANATPIQPSLQTPNRWTFDLQPGQSWVRISQNWHKDWKWRINGGRWQSFQNGSDASCWITSGLNSGGQIDVKFFPRPLWLTLVSSLAGLIWFTIIVRKYSGISQARHPSAHPA